nr:MAG TPA: tail tape measure protein [Caudoviricetes sp.]
MVEAATTFRKSGFNDQDAAILAKVAAQYQNVADTAVSAEDAASSIVSQIRAFGEDADFATHVIDAYNEVANNFSVGTNDLSQAMEIASAGMATYGNEFEQIIGLVTSGTEIMTGRSSQVARGLNTIASRIVKNQGALEDYGIQVEDVNGNLKSTYDVLAELKPTWDSMSEAERVALGDAIAGTNQYKVLASVMQNFKHATDATTTALNSSGSAIKENAAYMESLEAKTTAVKATFQDLANNVIDDELVGAVLDLANGFLQLANTDLGRIVTQITLLTGVGWGATGLLQASKIIPSVISQFKNFGAAASLAASGASGFFEALSVGGGVLTGILPIILAVAAALAVGGALWKATEDSRKSIDELNDSIDTDNQKLQTNKERLDEINGMAWNDKTPEILAEKDALEKENAELETQIEKYRKLAKEQARQTLENASTIETSYTEKTDRKTGRTRLEQTTTILTGEDYYQKLIDKLREYQDILNKTHELNDEQLADYQKTASEASRLADAINILNPDIMTATESERQLTYALADAQEAMSSASSYVSNYVDGLYQTGQEAKKTGDALTEYVVNAIIDVNNTDLLTNQKVAALQSIMSQADLTSTELVDVLANAIITVGNTNLDVSGQIANLQALALQAGYTAQAVAAVFGMDENTVSNQVRTSATGYMLSQWAKGNKISSEQAMAWAKKNYASSLWSSLKTSYTPTAPTVTTTGGGGGGTSTSKQTQKNKKEAKDAVKEVKKDAEDAVNDVSNSVSDALNEQKQMMQGVIDYYVEYASRKIEELQDQIDAINDKYDQMLQDAEDRAQAQLDALEAQNEAVEDQIALQQKLEALDKAKNTMQMVFKDGQFVYQADADEVSKSQNELNAYYRQKDYENRKKYIEDSLKAEKQYIETLRKNETAALEEEKARWEEYKEGWSNLTSEYEFQQNKLLADQMFGIEQENANWQTRLANLQSFASQYNALMGSLSGFGSGGAGGRAFGSGGIADGNLWGDGNDNLNTWDLNSAYNSIWDKDKDYGVLLEDAIKKGYGIDWISGVAGQRNAKLKALGLEGKVESTQALFDRLVKQYGYHQGYTGEYGTFQGGSGHGPDTPSNRPSASSPVSASNQSAIMRLEDQIANNSEAWFNASPAERERLHDENERLRKELERLNPRGYASGTLSARSGLSMVGEQGPELRVLNKGDGIIPADITRNLMKIGSDPRWFANRSGAGNTILNVANVSLPSVRNAQQFVDGLKQMAIQRSYAAT